jgi:iron complex outermembrane receptor protein
MLNNSEKQGSAIALLLASAALVFMPSCASAQDVAPTPDTTAAPSNAGAALDGTSAPASETGTQGVGDIIVTARKREESLQRTPISISALGAKQLDAQGITSILKIQDIAPNVAFKNVPTNSGVASNAAVYIRGIGQSDFAPSVDPGVGIYVDGVYQGRSVGGVFDMIDIDRVEVLRGPQGTLFGRNTIGGAVSIITAKPTDDFHGKADVKVGTDNRVNVRAMLNMPLADTLFLKVSGGLFSQDGYVNAPNLGTKLGNQDTKTARGVLLWEAAPNLDLTLSADFMRDKNNGAPFTMVALDLSAPHNFGALNNALVTGFGALGSCADAAHATNPNCLNSQWFSRDTNYSSRRTFSDIKLWSTALTADWDLTANVKVKSITSYRKVDALFAVDYDTTSIDIAYLSPDTFTQRQFTQELQLLGTAFDDRLNYLFGLYYFHEKGKDVGPIDLNAVYAVSGGFYNYSSWAAFSQATYKITDRLSLTAGLRYTQDRKRFLPDQYIVDDRLGTLLGPANGSLVFSRCFVRSGPPIVPPNASCVADPVLNPDGNRILPFVAVHSNANRLTPMVNLAYQWTPDIMTYVTFSQGYKSGGFTQRIFPPEPSMPTFKPEKVNAYEGGLKLTALDRKVRLNVAAFYTDYSEIQLLVDGTPYGRQGPFYINAGDAEIKGFEAEATIAPGSGWLLTGSAGLTDAKYTRLNNTVGLTLNSKFNYVPKWTLSGTIEKVIDLGSAGTVTPHGDWSYRSGTFNNLNGLNDPQLFQPGYSLFNASVRWEDATGKYGLQAGVDNIANKKYLTFGNFQQSYGIKTASYDRGRQWYVRASVNF